MWFEKNTIEEKIKNFSEEEKVIAYHSVLVERNKKEIRQKHCKHINIRICGSNLVGDATCLDCGKVDRLYVFMNGMFKEFNELYNKMTTKKK